MVAAQRTAALDVGGLAVVVIAVVLALYLPLQGNNTVLQMAVLVAYPVGLIESTFPLASGPRISSISPIRRIRSRPSSTLPRAACWSRTSERASLAPSLR